MTTAVDCTFCGGTGSIVGGERGEVMQPCPRCSPPNDRTVITNLKALLAARPQSSILDVYAHPTLTDKLIISEQLKRIEILLERIVKKIEEVP